MPRAALLLFAKVPVPGRVKTRLFGPLSPEQAAEVHRACLCDTLELCERVRGAIPHLYVDGLGLRSGAAAWWRTARPDWRVRRQVGRDLGERLANAFKKAFAEGHAAVVAIGTDTPWMGAGRIRIALEVLHNSDVALGPTADGGYYLVGARRSLPGMFRGIPWGTRRVWVETLRAARLAPASVDVLPRDFDLDRPADLEQAARMLRGDPQRAPTLARVLTQR